MRDLEKEKRTYRDTRYGCLIEIVILALFIGFVVHFILTIIRNIP